MLKGLSFLLTYCWMQSLAYYIHQKLEAPGYLCIGVMVGGRCSVHRYPLLRGVFTI